MWTYKNEKQVDMPISLYFALHLQARERFLDDVAAFSFFETKDASKSAKSFLQPVSPQKEEEEEKRSGREDIACPHAQLKCILIPAVCMNL